MKEGILGPESHTKVQRIMRLIRRFFDDASVLIGASYFSCITLPTCRSLMQWYYLGNS
jgi:hypothetical protein